MAAAIDKPIRFGILGCADIARKVTRAIHLAPNAVLCAVGSRSIDKARRFIADNAPHISTEVKAYGSYEEVLDDAGIDAVYVPLPTSLHVRWAVAAAEKGKHLLLEKPTALCAADLDVILAACEAGGIQFMDSTMWVHHPRTAKMRELLCDPDRFGQLKSIHSVFTFCVDTDFLQNDIRVKPDLDALGVLGDEGCFLSNLTIDLTVIGTNGTLRLHDFIIPFEEGSAKFSLGTKSWFNDLVTGWSSLPSEHVVTTDLPQEACMVNEFSRLVGHVRDSGSAPEKKWPTITRKTQLVIDAVKASIDRDYEPVEIVV
ncbi:putative oxidoreductase [Acorus calamus]|uniref:Oxidoreductase n=1 Tax=Acorus calamus TaxID=4465 RepID=A0AAV9CMW4_ACOCL|nr:putative oxidoreductase [Acorus calamus]